MSVRSATGSPQVPHGESDLFLLGLLSLIDAMMEMPMSEVLDKVPPDRETKAVLLGQASMPRAAYQLMLAHESGGSGTRSAAWRRS
jgi:c-di-GMP-related signal transduction protein